LIAILMWALHLAAWYLMRSAMRFLYYDAHMHFLNRQAFIVAGYGLHTVVSVALGPITPVALVLLYYDQRVRKEGYDIERMIEAAGLTVPDPASAAENATLANFAVDGGQAQPADESTA
jgi:hypothetical protein